MAGPEELVRTEVDGRVFVTSGSRVLYVFDTDDIEMRNLAIASLRAAGVAGVVVAALFEMTDRHVSAIRTRVQREGSRALVGRRGRPAKLTDAQKARARRWKAEGVAGSEIARRLGVSDATISRVTADVAVTVPLIEDNTDDTVIDDTDDTVIDDTDTVIDDTDTVIDGIDGHADDIGIGIDRGAVALIEGTVSCRYAGAMLLHGFLAVVDAGAVLGGGRRGRQRYRQVDVALCVMFGLVLGAGSVEAIKHLGRGDLGALWGAARAPELKTLRARLGALADSADALAMQRRLTAALLAATPDTEQVFYVDDHFVPYYGARPLAKGWNTKRRHAMAGWDDTFICDTAGRVLAFTSSEPSGLSVTMRDALGELAGAGAAGGRVMVGFDRGGSYPGTFAWLDTQGFDWVTWRRGPLATPAAEPTRSWCDIDGTRRYFTIADETVTLTDDYGPARQITLYDNGEPAVQVLTSDTTATAARLIWRLQQRWRIENTFKYLTAHHGIDQICDYRMDLIDDERPITNPARQAINTELAALRAEHGEIERRIGETFANRTHDPDTYRRLTDQRHMIADEIQTLETHRKTIPAKIPANTHTPGTQRALPKFERRAYQMVLRLLTYNADRWLAEHLNTYLDNPDHIRATCRHLYHQPGTITYTPHTITVTITTRDQPATANALTKLCDELNHTTTPAHIPGDPRPITYQTHPRHRTPQPTRLPEV
jgi:transposase